jgi:hypothetical protein
MNYSFPRELIKWIQNLNLEYSFKDIKRDLVNGYFIAEIFSKYYPSKISMHSFTNSNSSKVKDDNWGQLGLVLKTNGFKVNKVLIEEIKRGNMDSIIVFMNKFYSFLTQKQLNLLKKIYKQKKMKIGNGSLNNLITESYDHSKSNEAKEIRDNKTAKKKSAYASSLGKDLTVANSSIMNKENSFENTLNGNLKKSRQSTVNFIESESSYVKVDSECKSSAMDNWHSIQRLQSQSIMNSKLENPDQSQNPKKTKIRPVYSSKMELINSQSKIKDLLNSVIKKVFGSDLDEEGYGDNLYLYVTKNISHFEIKDYSKYLNFLLDEQESIW